MIGYKNISRFSLFFIVTYIVLLFPEGVGKVYNRILRNASNQVFNSKGNEEVVFFAEGDGGDKSYDTRLHLSSSAFRLKNNDYKSVIYQLKFRRIGFVATAFLLALIVATPIGWKRKFIALALGFFLMLIFILIKLRVMILYTYSITQSIPLHKDPGEMERLKFWDEIFANLNTNGYYFAVLVWLLLCFRRNDWQKLNGELFKLNEKFVSGRVKKKR
jgi:hypothetical protein